MGSVNIFMHYYICPYCPPTPDTRLEPTEEIHTNNRRVWKCKKCGDEFVGIPTFLKEQKRKIKDG